MRSSHSRFATTVVVGLLVGGCAAAASPAPPATPSGSPTSQAPAVATPGATSAVSTASPSLAPVAAAAMAPVRGSAREIGERVLMAPGPDGTLYVSIPRPGGSVLALLDRGGRPRPGWPITVKDSTACGLLLPVADGSVRLVCDGTDLPRFDNDLSDVRALGFDAGGASMAGWPVTLRPGTGSVVGAELTLLEGQIGTDTADVGVTVSHVTWMTTVAADASIRSGTKVPLVETCCGEQWAVGPDGIAYGTTIVSGFDEEVDELSQITALDRAGVRAGWPVSFDGIASGPAFGPGGRTVVTVGYYVRKTSRVLAFQRDGEAVAATSAELSIASGEVVIFDGPYECGLPRPRTPLLAKDGTIFVTSEIDTAVFALDPSLEVIRGWPYRPATPLVYRFSPSEELSCGSLAIPAASPDGTLYLPLRARDETAGGSLVAVGPDGRVRPGWPVELKRPGAEFWSVVVGSDGTIYALAVEPETGDTSSASILAIAPDSTVLYTTTIIEP